jgi:hypothetical protein
MPYDEAVRNETIGAFRRAIGALRKHQARILIAMCDGTEIAEIAVRLRMHRARAINAFHSAINSLDRMRLGGASRPTASTRNIRSITGWDG